MIYAQLATFWTMKTHLDASFHLEVLVLFDVSEIFWLFIMTKITV